MAKTVVGLFDDYSDAQDAVRDLEGMGFTRDQVSVVANQGGTGTGDGTYAGDTGAGDVGDAAATGAGTGAVAGAGIGGAVGLLAGLGALAIPGFGPVLAAGPLIATITGAGIGAAAGAGAGGLIGALTEAGVPEEHAGYYEEGVRRGGTLVTVNAPDGQSQQVVDVMNRHHVVDIDRRARDYSATGVTGRAGYESPTRTDVDNTNRGYAGVATGSNTGFEAAESDLTTGGNPDAARGNSGMGYTAGATGAGNPTSHSWNNDEEVGADADYSGAGAAVNHGYRGINADPPTGGGYATGGNIGEDAGDLGTGGRTDVGTGMSDRDVRYEGGSAGLNAGGGHAGGYAGSSATGAGSTAGGADRSAGMNTGVPVNPNAGVGPSGALTGQGAVDGGVRDSSRQPDYNEANSRELAGVAHEDMPSRDDMRSTIPDTRVTSDSDEEDLGDTDQDLNRNRPGETNVY